MAVELALRNVAPSASGNHVIWRPFRTSNPASAGCNSSRARDSITPSLRVAEFEDENDDEDEYEAPSLLFQYLDSGAFFGAKGGSGER
jgi:hypothetical protein